MGVADVVGVVSAFAAAGGFAVAAYQVAGIRKDAIVARATELDAVTVETEVVERPGPREVVHGKRRWKLRFTIHNPGRFPIFEVVAEVGFPVEIVRVHHGGTKDDPTTTVCIETPVIAARGSRCWTRLLEVDEHASQMAGNSRTVRFTTPDVGTLTTVGPEVSTPGGRHVRRILARTKVARATN